MARFMRSDVGRTGHSQLKPPAIVYGPSVVRPRLVGRLAEASSPATRNPRASRTGHYGLHPPVVVTVNVPRLVRPRISGALAPPPPRPLPSSFLRPPIAEAVEEAAVVYPPLEVFLFPLRPRKIQTISFLRPPAVLAAIARPRLITSLFPLKRLPILLSSRLAAPVVVGTTEVARARTLLFPLKRHPVLLSSRLSAPVVVGTSAVAQASRAHLFPLRDKRPAHPSSFLRPPVVAAAEPTPFPQISGSLFPLNRPPIILSSSLPQVIYEAEVHAPAVGILAPPRDSRPPVVSLLSPPTVVNAEAAPSEIKTSLVSRALRPTTSSFLRPPELVVAVGRPRISGFLARSKRPIATRPRLAPPTVITAERVYDGPRVSLAASSRKGLAVHPRLVPPAVVGPGIVYRGILERLAPSRRGTPKSSLVPPVVVHLAVELLGPRVTLSQSTLLGRRSTSSLGAPTDTKGLEDQGLVRIHLTRIRPVATLVSLGAPAVVVPAGLVYFGPNITLARIRPERTLSVLTPPAAIDLTPQTHYLTTALAYSLRGAPKSELRPPTAVRDEPQVFYLSLYLAPSGRGATKSRLFQPVVIDLSPQVYSVAVTLAYQSRRPGYSLLAPPTDIHGLEDQGRIEVTLAASPRQARATHSRLGQPTDTVGIEDQGRVRVTLARITPPPTIARLIPPAVVAYFIAPAISISFAPAGKPVAKSRLTAPVVVYTAVELLGPTVALTRIRVPLAQTNIFPPTVVVPATQIYFGPEVALAAGTRDVTDLRRQSRSVLGAPVVIGPPVQFWGPGRLFARKDQKQRRRPRYFLAAPTVVTYEIPFAETRKTVSLAPSSYGVPKSRLFPPAVVTYPTFYGPSVTLVRIAPVKTAAVLNPAVVVHLAVEIYGPETALARIRPVRTIARLFPPTDTKGLEDQGKVRITLAPQRRGVPKSRLFPPTDTVGREDQGRVRVTLARITPPPTQALLSKPTVVFPFIARTTVVALAPSFRGTPKPFLAPPVVVDAFIARALLVTLAPQRRGAPKSHLTPPTVVFPFFARQTSITLAPQRRGVPKSLLSAPAVIDDRPQTYYLSVSFALIKPQPTTTALRPPTITFPANPPVDAIAEIQLVRIRPVRTRYALRKPVVVQAFIQRPLAITLAPQSRGVPKSTLFPPTDTRGLEDQGKVETTLVRIRPVRTISSIKPPTVVRYFVARPTSITLADPGKPRTRSLLLPPAVIGIRPFRPLLVSLAANKPQPTVARLSAPTVVFPVFFARPVAVTLAPHSRGVPKSALLPPAVEGIAPHRPILVQFARITPPPVHSKLFDPAVIGDGIYFRGILVHLAPSSRGVPQYWFTFVPSLKVIPGQVCGYDEAAAEVCGDEDSAKVSGSTSGASVSGVDSAGVKVEGGDSGPKVTGRDEGGG